MRITGLLLSIFFVIPVTLFLSCATAQQLPVSGGIRIATFNCSLNRNKAGELLVDLESGDNLQARQVARILRMVRPDIVLLNEFDYDEGGGAVDVFRRDYLEASGEWTTEQPLPFEYAFSGPVNTGLPSGLDLDHDGRLDGWGDAFGFGRFPGQYGMVLLSRFPIDFESVRTFQKLLWKNLPASSVPTATTVGAEAWYTESETETLRLSSKSHWDVPVAISDRTLHLLVSHPTPPAFDGTEDRNGRRNHDEIRLWAEYISDQPNTWLTDDNGIAGGLASDASFVILGDQNADPQDGDSFDRAIDQLLNHSRINAGFTPASEGAANAAKTQGKVNNRHRGDPSQDTADFSDSSVGNLRADYVLPGRDLKPLASGVFWPLPGTPGAELLRCSDHRLVWMDFQF